MAQIVLLHHVLGLTDGVLDIADTLTEVGHDVLVPDLFEGRRFDAIPEGLAYVESVGDEELSRRVDEAVSRIDGPAVYGGFSLGVAFAQPLLATRPALGGLLVHGFLDPGLTGQPLPDGVPVHVFGMDRDPFLTEDGDLDAAHRWTSGHSELSIHLYPGSGHLFAEPRSPDYDAAAAAALVADMIAAVDAMAAGA